MNPKAVEANGAIIASSITKYLSGQIDRTGKVLEDIGKDQGFEFTIDKSNERYVELGGSNKTATFKLW